MTNLTITATEFASIASVVAATSSDLVTPILMGVQITVSPAVGTLAGKPAVTVTATGTDRYIVGRTVFDVTPDTDEDAGQEWAFVAHKDSLTAAARAVKSSKALAVTLTFEPDATTLSVEFNGSRALLNAVTGNYPAVDRLIPDVTADKHDVPPTGLNLSYLTRIDKLVSTDDGRGMSSRQHEWTFAAARDEKRAPIILRRGSLVALAQPIIVR